MSGSSQAYPEQVIGPNVPTARSVVNGTTLAITFSTGLNSYTQYDCYVTANTSVGEGTQSPIITTKTSESVPSSPLALSVSTVSGSPNQLSASWSSPIPKNGIIIAYTIYCNTSASQAYPEQVIGPNVPTARSVVNGTTLAVMFSTGLNPYTRYDCYVTANTSVGEGIPSPVMTTRTSESVPSSPLAVSVSNISGSPNQLSVSWSSPIPKNGIIIAYTIYCNTSASQAYPEQVIGPNMPTARSVVNGTTLAVAFSTGLNTYTQYDCYVTANTSVGEGTPSPIITTQTSESVPSSPRTLSVSTVSGSPNQLSASWSSPIPKNGIIIAYTIYCNTSASQAYPEQVIGPNVPTARSVGNGTMLAVMFSTGLNPYTRYDCYVTANTSVGEGIPSPVMTTRTSESVPSSPLAVSVYNISGSPNQLSVSWSLPIPKNGIIIAYTIYCNTSASQAYPEQVIGPNVPTARSVVNGTTLAVAFSTGLNMYTQYDCYVTANTSVGEGTPSPIITTQTSESVPSSPLALSVSTVSGSPNQLSASWSSPIPKNGIIIAYTIYCNTSASQAYPEQVIGPNVPTARSVVNGTMLAVMFSTGLNPYTRYDCYVTANTSFGEGTPSPVITTRTSESVGTNSFKTTSLDWIIGPNVPTARSFVNGTTLAVTFRTGLNPYTRYDCYVTANTSVGEGIPSPVMTTRTSESVPSSPLAVSVSNVSGSPNQLSVSWSSPIPKNGIIIAYTIYCNTSASQAYPEQVIGTNMPTARSVVNGTTLAVAFSTGLNTYTQYDCYVTANTSVGEGTPSPIITTQTSESVPSSPRTLSVSTVSGSPNQLSASWSSPIPKNGVIIAYTIYCNTSASQAYPEQVIGPNVPTARSVVNGTMLAVMFSTGLNPYTRYDCYVTANTSFGEGTPSPVITTRTSESVPSSPLAVSVSTISGSPNQLSASWSSPIPTNGIIIAYTIYCNTSASQAYPEQVIGPNVPTARSVVNGTTMDVIFSTGLNPFTQYDCYVTTNTSVGEGTPSPIITTRTSESGVLTYA
eukprot:Em0003g1613a